MLDSVSPRSPSCLRPLPIAIAIALTGAAATAQSGLGAAAEYALLGLTNGTVSVNSASTVVGDFGYSAGVTSTTNQKIGGSVGTWTGTAYVHSAVAAFQAHPTNYAPSGGIVTSAAEDARLD